MLQIADVGVGPFSVTHSRDRAVDFSVAFYEDPAAILIPPPAEDNRLLACTKPFRLEVSFIAELYYGLANFSLAFQKKKQVWLTLMSFAVILPAILWQHLKFLWINYRKAVDSSRRINASDSPLEERRPNLAKQYFFVLGVLIGQCNFLFGTVRFLSRVLTVFLMTA